MSGFASETVPNGLEMSLDQYIKESGIYVSPMLNQRRIDDRSFIKGRRIRDVLNSLDDEDDDYGDDDDMDMFSADTNNIEVCKINNMEVNEKASSSNMVTDQQQQESETTNSQWRLFNGRERQLEAAKSVCSNDPDLEPYTLNKRPTFYHRYKNNILNKNRRNFGYNYYYNNRNNNIITNGRRYNGVNNHTRRPNSNLSQRLKIAATSVDTTVSVPTSGNKNNFIISIPNNRHVQKEPYLPNITTTASSKALNMGSLACALDTKDEMNSAVMPLVASKLLETFREMAGTKPEPKYDMKTQKVIHEVQQKALTFSCTSGEVISSDGKGLPITIQPQSSGLSLNNRFA